MNDQITSVSYSVFSNKGALALLLGSGISRSAGIPTGWEVVLDLIRQVAILEKAQCEPEPDKWFYERFGKEPDYSDLLESLTNTQTERLNLLRSYFEPDEAEREEGLKKPTLAHQMIARLVEKGYIRVIVTTNFDRLMENALKDIGIEPSVISNPGHIENTLPIVHSNITIIKINGDYLDTSFLNIKSELGTYDPRLENLMHYVFENFGLITCGWSAAWDIALREALKSANKFRFSNYFAYVGSPGEELENLATARQGKTVGIANADSFFKELHENVEALEASMAEHPLTPQVAEARLKKYVVREEHIISLHDLIKGEVDRVYDKFGDLSVNDQPTSETIKQRIDYYLQQTNTLCRLLVTGVYWGKEHHHDIWLKSLARFSSSRGRGGGIVVLLELERLPALIFLYAVGLSCMLRKDYKLLSKMLSMNVYSRYGATTILDQVNAHSIIDRDDLNQVLGDNKSVPMSELLFFNLRPYFESFLPNMQDYEALFDVFEYFMSLAYMKKVNSTWGPVSRFGYRIKRGGKANSFDQLLQEVEANSGMADLYSPNLFTDLADLKQTNESFKEFFERYPIF